MAPENSVFIFGASGHAKVVIDILEKQNVRKVAFLVDDNPQLKGANFYGYSVLGGRTELLAATERNHLEAIVAIGDNHARIRVANWLRENGFALARAIHPSVLVARGVSIGAGTVVMAGALINSDTVIGENVIINTGSIIDHDCVIGDGVHVAPGCRLCGGVRVGERSFLGVGTNVIPGISIGRGAFIGAGSTVIRNVEDGAKVAGSPARPIES